MLGSVNQVWLMTGDIPAGGPMARHYCSFLVRWWVLDHRGLRIEVEQIQTGIKTVFKTPDQAIAWMNSHVQTELPRSDDTIVSATPDGSKPMGEITEK